MNIQTRKATLEDAHAIAQNLSEVSKGELLQKGITWWEALRLAHEFMALGPAEVAIVDDEPACILGHIPAETARVTWFMATEPFFNLGPRGVVYARRYMARLRREYPGMEFHSYTNSPHQDADRWFRALGFKPRFNAAIFPCRQYVLAAWTQGDALRDGGLSA